MKKKILALLFVVTMVCSIVACGEKNTEQGKDNGTEQELDENAKPYLGVWTSAKGQILAFFEDGTCYLDGDNKHTYKMNGKACEIDEHIVAEITDEIDNGFKLHFSELGIERTYYRGTEKSVEEQKKVNSDISWLIGKWTYDDDKEDHVIREIAINEDGTCDLTINGDVISANWEKGTLEQDDLSGITIYINDEPRYYFVGIPMLEMGYWSNELPTDHIDFDKFAKE